MNLLKTIFNFLIVFIYLFFVNGVTNLVSAKATVEFDTPKEAKSKLKEEPDMLVEPDKETSSEKKKLFKGTKKTKKNKKPSKFLKPKKIKNRTFLSVKSEYKAPKTFDQYVAMSKDVKRSERKVAEPNFPRDDKIVNMPDPGLRVVKYNSPPGSNELDLRLLLTRHQLVTKGVLSPDSRRLAYSVVYSYPTSEQVASEMFYINIPEKKTQLQALRDFHTIEAERNPILKTGTDRLFQYEKRTFTILDWSEDGQKIAVCEKIGSQTQGPWKTQVWVYDFQEQKGYELTAVREAIRYYWKSKYKIDLIDYMWDIYPVGWDLYNVDRIVVLAYLYGENHKGAKFLGTWSIDYQNQRSELMSETDRNFEVSINGYALEFKRQ